MSQYVSVAKPDEIPNGRGLTVRVGEREFALFSVDGTIYALDGRCPHRGAPLAEGIVEMGHVYCPMHGWRFDATTGACLDNLEKSVQCFPTRVFQGEIQILI